VRFGARAALLPGLALLVAGLLLLLRAPVDGTYLGDILPSMLLLGVGAGLSFPSLMTLSMSDATADDSGLASGLANTTLQVGGALGLAVLTTLSTTRTNSLLALGESPASALTGGYHLALAVGVGLLVAAVAITVTLLRPRGRTAGEAASEAASASAERTDADETEPAQA
jgi:hypothetical protein